MTDPAFFARHALGVELHEGQKRWLEGSVKRENLLVTGNRWGKSFVSAVKIIHRVIYRPRPLKYDRSGRYRIVTAAITQDQAAIIFDEVVRLVRQHDWLNALVTKLVRTPFPRLVFGNNAVVEARSTQNRGEYLLGHDYDLFIFDEVAFESDPDYVVEEVIQMRLADREGRLDLVSTPNGRNWFCRRAQEIMSGARVGYFQSGDSRENPYISSEFLGDRLRFFSDRRVQQNIMGQFVDAGGEVLPGAYVDRALSRAAEIEGSARVDPDGALHISGWDLARKQTATVGITVEVVDGHAHVVALERLRRFDWNIVIRKIRDRQERFPGPLVIDATGLGDVVVEQLADYNPIAMIFTGATKASMLTNVELMHARGLVSYGRWELPDGPGRQWALEDELRGARWDDNGRCDGLMALALALWPLAKPSVPEVAPRVGRV